MINMRRNGISWVIGGPQGSGVDTAASIFAKACALGNLHIFGKREYHSNIKGEHSYFTILVSSNHVRAHVDTIDVLAVFDTETLFRHAPYVSSDGMIVYDESILGHSIDSIPTIDSTSRSRSIELLEHHALGRDTDDMLKAVAMKGVKTYSIPCNNILEDITKKRNEPSLSKLTRLVNMIIVTASVALLDYNYDMLVNAIRYTFRARKSLADMNIEAATYTYNYTKARYDVDDIPLRLHAREYEDNTLLIQGNQSIALGKITAGCRYQSYYPITPASDESEFLEANEVIDESNAILVVQTEDEIAAITSAIGAALAGSRASTSTSGPGFSLMAEALGWAGINEVPVVVTLYQRAGPSTGLPTRHEQGDLLFAVHAGHGEFPRIVIASGDVEEAFYDTIRAFNYAERYQLPVIHIVDKALANSIVTCSMFDTSKVSIDRGRLVDHIDGAYKRFDLRDTISPRIRLGTSDVVFWNTGDEHDELGHITEDPELRISMMDKRMKKLELILDDLSDEEKAIMYDDGSDATIVTWGSCKGAVLDAIDMLREDGIRLNCLYIKLLHPFPSQLVASMLRSTRMLIDVEMNHTAQLSALLRNSIQKDADYHIVKYNGRPISSSEVYSTLKGIMEGKIKDRRVVLRHGV
jgi:2-oxoglutarate/2-oxoacid ferredoxin oxidoreductase subunit alpha